MSQQNDAHQADDVCTASCALASLCARRWNTLVSLGALLLPASCALASLCARRWNTLVSLGALLLPASCALASLCARRWNTLVSLSPLQHNRPSIPTAVFCVRVGQSWS